MTEHTYLNSRVAVDAVVFTVVSNVLAVYLLTRKKEPFQDFLELPGGLLTTGETAEGTVKRKLTEVLGDTVSFLEQFYTFTDPTRDPRGRTISVGFLALVDETSIRNEGDWYPVAQLSSLAFDHKNIVLKAQSYLKNQLHLAMLEHMLPKFFPLNDLQHLYEVITNEQLDNRNFRKQILASGEVEETDKFETNVQHRPAKLYKFK